MEINLVTKKKCYIHLDDPCQPPFNLFEKCDFCENL